MPTRSLLCLRSPRVLSFDVVRDLICMIASLFCDFNGLDIIILVSDGHNFFILFMLLGNTSPTLDAQMGTLKMRKPGEIFFLTAIVLHTFFGANRFC